jgi:hypothetical protein
MKRTKPRQHIRRLKSGKRVIVNKGVKRRRSFYKKSAFKKALDVATPEERRELQGILQSAPLVGGKKQTAEFMNEFNDKINEILDIHLPKTRIGEEAPQPGAPRVVDKEAEARRKELREMMGVRKEKPEFIPEVRVVEEIVTPEGETRLVAIKKKKKNSGFWPFKRTRSDTKRQRDINVMLEKEGQSRWDPQAETDEWLKKQGKRKHG